MPVTRIKVGFKGVYVWDSSDLWGPGDWCLTAKVDGKTLGDPKHEFEAREKQWIMLPEKDWSTEIDVTGKKPGDTISVSFSVKDIDLISDDDLGAVTLTLKYPFRTERDEPIRSPIIKGWLFFPDHQYYSVHIVVKILEVKATTTLDKTGGVLVSRQHDGSSTFSTISGKAITPRVEVCPVIPVPAAPSKLPDRPAFPAELVPGKETIWAKAIPLRPELKLNDLVNPSLIPVLLNGDPDLQSKAAKIAVTWIWPGDLDLSMVTWHVKEGPIEIVGSNNGAWVLVRGTSAPSDTMATLEVRWDGLKGPLLATYRAWVGVVKEVPYRINIINGVDPVGHPERSPIVTPDNVNNHIRMARVLLWQAGLELTPDSNTTLFDGATATAHKGVFIVPAKKDNWTNNVDINSTPIATRLNFRPLVVNIAYVRSCSENRAVASDTPGFDGKSQKLGGSPSTSWVIPSGVPPDATGKEVTMLTLGLFPRNNSSDAAYAKERAKTDPGFTLSDINKRLYSLMAPSIWTPNTNSPDWGQNISHELGHVLALRHRGSGDTDKKPLSDDGVNSVDNKKKKRGHPWNENIMTYDNQRGLDIDLIQTAVVRRHPAAKKKP